MSLGVTPAHHRRDDPFTDTTDYDLAVLRPLSTGYTVTGDDKAITYVVRAHVVRLLAFALLLPAVRRPYIVCLLLIPVARLGKNTPDKHRVSQCRSTAREIRTPYSQYL
jgi:hypothetical protein